MARLALSLLPITLAGCVEPFAGSNVQLDFAAGTLIPARGAPPVGLEPPADTFMALYAIDEVRAAAGPVSEVHLFEVQRFELRPVIDRGSPCFIELEDARYPGLHVTSHLDKVLAETGIFDPLAPPASASQDDRIDALLAWERNGHLAALETQVKAVTSTAAVHYGAVASGCVEDSPASSPEEIPPATCTGELSNQRRLALCRAAWAANPLLYEGSDKVFTLPLNGRFHGAVEGTNPINNGQLGGSSFFVDEVLVDFEAYAIRWQWKDLDGDGAPDYPPGTPPAQRSPTGNLYMTGRPEVRTRGVTSVRLEHPLDPSIAAELSVIADLAQDEVSF